MFLTPIVKFLALLSLTFNELFDINGIILRNQIRNKFVYLFFLNIFSFLQIRVVKAFRHGVDSVQLNQASSNPNIQVTYLIASIIYSAGNFISEMYL